MSRFPGSAVIAALLTLATAPAFAHAHLRSASPAADSAGPAPVQVVCNFTEALEPRYSGLEVHDASGQRVDEADMHLAADDAKRMIVGMKRLAPGVYTVLWHATSIDTHKTEGRFAFTVRP